MKEPFVSFVRNTTLIFLIMIHVQSSNSEGLFLFFCSSLYVLFGFYFLSPPFLQHVDSRKSFRKIRVLAESDDDQIYM